MIDVAVVVCTRNRPKLLGRALASLNEQTFDRARFEVIVVDNGDGRGQQTANVGGADVVLRERSVGLSRSRNTGWRAATAGVVAFLDDDAEAAPDWLERAVSVFSASGAAAVGGPILPLYDVPPPVWFRDDYEQRTWGERERRLRPGESLSGSNMFIGRNVLEEVRGFDERLGMKGDGLSVGEETELFERLWKRPDMAVVYSPHVVVRHRVASFKTTVTYQLRRNAASGEAWAIRQNLGRAARVRRVVLDSAMAVVLTLRALARFRRPREQWAVEELGHVAARLGSVKGVLR
jgi:glycosyltransferase involved in cell wall biosynthesis